MIDLHCHILPGIDDGAPNLAVSLEMARMAVADGITTMACTPHIMAGVYDNTARRIRAAVDALSAALAQADIPLQLVTGADVHAAPDLLARLRDGRIPTLNDGRHFLFEPPHHVLLPRLEDFAFSLMTAGYVPIVTHPERLAWIESHYSVVKRLAAAGALTQLTAGSLTGRFGRRVRYWSERMLDEDLVHLIATDAHNASRRPPLLAEAREAVARRLGPDKATLLVATNPEHILKSVVPSDLPSSLSDWKAGGGR